jgi:hypothetical protein
MYELPVGFGGEFRFLQTIVVPQYVVSQLNLPD